MGLLPRLRRVYARRRYKVCEGRPFAVPYLTQTVPYSLYDRPIIVPQSRLTRSTSDFSPISALFPCNPPNKGIHLILRTIEVEVQKPRPTEAVDGADTPSEWPANAMSHTSQHVRRSLNGVGSETEESATSDHLDEVFGLLSNSRRRAAISVLLEHENLTRKELVDRVAELEYGLPIDEISSDERHTIHVSLTQSHICTLDDSGVLERHEEGDGVRVTLGPRADELAQWMHKQNGGLGSKLKRSITALC